MRKAVGTLALALLLSIPALVPTAGAHAAPDPLDNSVHVLSDEPEDAFYWYDGYDLYNLFVREAHIEPLDETGLVFRYTLYGGFGPASTSDQLGIDVEATTPEGAQSLSINTTDDQAWEGDLEVLVANVTEDEAPWTGVTARMQVFASYEQLGTGPGGSVEDVRMVSRADDEARDIAPGGFFLPHTQGQAEVPAESQRLADTLELTGPTGYINASAASTDEGLVVDIQNALENGQHVSLDLEVPEGWNATVNGSSQTSLDGGDTTTFAIDADAGPEAREPLAMRIVTDLGGHRTLFAGVNGTELTTSLESQSVDVDPSSPEPNESPAPSALLIVALLAGLAGIARRRN